LTWKNISFTCIQFSILVFICNHLPLNFLHFNKFIFKNIYVFEVSFLFLFVHKRFSWYLDIKFDEKFFKRKWKYLFNLMIDYKLFHLFLWLQLLSWTPFLLVLDLLYVVFLFQSFLAFVFLHLYTYKSSIIFQAFFMFSFSFFFI
jgi:hypothetical protein